MENKPLPKPYSPLQYSDKTTTTPPINEQVKKPIIAPPAQPIIAPVQLEQPKQIEVASDNLSGIETKIITEPVTEFASSLNPVSIGKRPHADDIRIIGGKGYDVRQPVPIKYPDVRQHFLSSRENFWTPHEIPMGDDKVQWNTGVLSEEEVWLFKCNISYLTASDNLVPDNLDNAILENITANEMRQYLRWQIAEESNHIESYFFILESFGLDEKGQGKIFELYHDVPELVNKLNWNLTFTNNVVNCEAPKGSHEANRALLEDLVSYYVFEYLFFPLGFSQVFALARQGKLRNTAQQYQYIWRDECVTADTDVLTPKGWIPFPDLKEGGLVAQYNNDGTIEFVEPSRIVAYETDTDVLNFSNKTGIVDFTVTENHRIIWSNPHNTCAETLAKDMKVGNRKKFIVSGKLQCDAEEVKSELTPYERFLIAFQADGYMSHGSRTWRYTGEICGHIRVKISVKKERKITRLKEILKDCGFDYDVTESKKDFYTFRINAPISVTKNFSDWVDLTKVDSDWCNEFIKECSHWDGHRKYDDYSHILYASTDKPNADLVHSIATLAGHRSHQTTVVDNREARYKDLYRVYILTDKDTVDTQSVKVTKQHYKGKAYCVTVPSGMFLIRRNGKSIVTGNCEHAINERWLILQIIKENPALWDAKMQQRTRAIVDEAVQLEINFGKATMPSGGFSGLSVQSYSEYAQLMGDNLLKSLGLKPLFNIKEHPMQWLAEFEMKQEVNFFEGRVRDYRVGGGLEW